MRVRTRQRGWHLEAGEGKGQRLQKEHGPAATWILATGHPFLTSDPQNCKRISLCCFKLLSLP